MTHYTLTSYEPVMLTLPKPQVPQELVTAQIERLLEPLAEYHEVDGDRAVQAGDFIVVTTRDARIDGNPASHFNLDNSLYHVGAGEMPKAFDDSLLGMVVGETREVKAMMKMPIGKKGDMSLLTMTVTVHKMLYCVRPELTDELVVREFGPAKTVEEFRRGVAAQFGKPDMPKDDPNFPDIVLGELGKRLVEQPDAADRLPGMPDEALRITCAIDALADYLEIELTDEQVTAEMPGDDDEQRKKIRKQIEDQGKGDEARTFARREAALSWLVNRSKVSYN